MRVLRSSRRLHVMIDWSAVSPDELGELYDALYERNQRIDKALDEINYRINGDRARRIYAMQNEALGLSNDLSSAVHDEIKRRHGVKWVAELCLIDYWKTATPDELSELYDALYERNERLMRTLDQIHIRFSGDRSARFHAAREAILHISYYLANSILAEIKKRDETKENK
jgi:thermostable 8-oxoguanine DNA glycosylase